MPEQARHSVSSEDRPQRSDARLPAHLAYLGDFELRREVGRGGMGTVYEAWQTSLQRVVALKVLSGQIGSSPKAVIRFQREAQAAAKLHHTHIVPIFAQGEAEGNYFYAMEFVSGESLHAVISAYRRARNLDPSSDAAETVVLPRAQDSGNHPQICPRPESDKSGTLTIRAEEYGTPEFFRQVAEHITSVADALEYAHRQGVVHRDIKPHNLLFGEDGRIRISDFGLARLSEQPGVTMTGELVGSPLYMSPEQITGDPNKVDHRADIYSLGATLYEWLTLHPPYPGDTREQVIGRILSSEVTSVRIHNPDIPLDLETIALKAIERDPNRRYATAADFRDDLRRYMASRPIVARRAGVTKRVAKFVSRHQVAVLTSVSIVILATLAFATRSTRKQAETDRAAAQDAAAVAAEVKEQAAEVAEQNEILTNMLRSVLEANPVTFAEAAIPVVGSIVPKDARAGLLSGSSGPFVGTPPSIALSMLGHMYVPGRAAAQTGPEGVAAAASDIVSQALVLWSQGAWAQVSDVLNPYVKQNPQDFDAQELRMAVAAQLRRYQDVIDITTVFTGSAHAGRALVWRGMANLLLERPDESLQDLTFAIKEDENQSIWARMLRGLVWVQMNRPSEALIDFDAIIASSPEFVPAHVGRASAFLRDGRTQDAIAAATRALELENQNVDALVLRGDAYFNATDYASAERDYRAAKNLSEHDRALELKWWLVYEKAKLTPQRESAESGTRPQRPADGATDSRMPPRDPISDWLSRQRKGDSVPNTEAGGLHFPLFDFGPK